MRGQILSFLFGMAFSVTAMAEVALPEATHTLIEALVKNDGFDRTTLTSLFGSLSKNETILTKISTPSEKLPWYKYRRIFDGEARVNEGLLFWQENEETLNRAQAEYHVPPEIIVAILGVETLYGKSTGQFSVLDALNTLAFHYPPRSEFFTKELREFLLMTREEGISPLEPKGSYAGAMGKAQFISSSYRHFAVDFDHDGKRDLLGSASDAIGSVANYFHEHGWKLNDPVVVRAYLNRHGARSVSMQNPSELQSAKLHYSLTRLIERGIRPKTKAIDLTDRPVSLMAFEAEDDVEYWLGFHNFSVITKYNLSPHYAMAVYNLSEQLKKRKAEKS